MKKSLEFINYIYTRNHTCGIISAYKLFNFCTILEKNINNEDVLSCYSLIKPVKYIDPDTRYREYAKNEIFCAITTKRIIFIDSNFNIKYIKLENLERIDYECIDSSEYIRFIKTNGNVLRLKNFGGHQSTDCTIGDMKNVLENYFNETQSTNRYLGFTDISRRYITLKTYN